MVDDGLRGDPGGAPRVVLHVGTPKSGTTFLQRALWHHRDALREQAVAVPGDGGQDMFHAAIEVREVFDRWGLDPARHRGTWARLCRQARSFPGTTVMSHEMLAPATPAQVSAALAELDGVELSLVVTARDLGRQLVSEWQERVKNGSTSSFAGFARRALAQVRSGELDGLLWSYHHVPDVLQRWGAGIPPERVHLVMAPAPGADPAELWWRFGDACGFDGHGLDPAEGGRGGNQTLGRTQIALLRRVNRALDGRIEQPHYARVVKRQFAQRLLAAQDSPRPQTPPAVVEELRTLAEEWAEEVRRRGYVVHGDLAALVPPDAADSADSAQGAAGTAPDEVTAEEELAAAAAAIAELLVEKARRERRRPAATTPATPEAPATPTTVSPARRAARRLRRAAGGVRARVRRAVG